MKVFFALLCFFGCLPALAASPSVVVVLLPGTSLLDWQNADAPALHRLMRTGAIAVMNTRTAHQAGRTETETLQSALLTLGAGARAAGTSANAAFLPVAALRPGTTISAAALFERRTGIKPPPGSAVCPDWPAVVSANRNSGYDLHVGNLADTLAQHGVSIASGGGPESDWLAASGDGIVRHVPALEARPGFCLIWDAGPDLKSADTALAGAAAQIAALRGRLIVLSPSSRNRHLAPVLVWGPGTPAGALYSPSTHHFGLVTNTDFAPTLAADFGIPRNGLQTLPFGFAWSALGSSGALARAGRLETEAEQQSLGMHLLPYAAAALGLWILAVTVLSSRFSIPGVLYLVPVAALTAALFAGSALSFSLLLLGLAAVFSLSARFVSAAHILTLTSAGLVLVLCADMVTENALMHRGLLGYSALEGARYYGIGNEAMGLLLGAALVAISNLWKPGKVPQILFVALMLGIVVLLGSAGAKAGGVLVSLAVFSTFLLTVGGRPWTVRKGALLAAVVLSGITLAALGDGMAFHTKGHSHIGEAVQRIALGGSGEAWDIIQRKLAVEGRLAYHSAWAILLWVGVFCTGWLFRAAVLRNSRDNALRSAGIAGLLTCLLLNDAGVVAAAIFGIFFWSAASTQKNLPALEASRAERQVL